MKTAARIDALTRIIEDTYQPDLAACKDVSKLSIKELEDLYAALHNCSEFVWTLKTLKEKDE